MRTSAHCLALAPLLLCGCSSDDNYVLSGSQFVIISPVRSSLSAQMNFTDTNGTPHPQWVIAMTDTADLCTKLAAHPDYFQHAIEPFDAAIVWVPTGNVGTYFVGQQSADGATVGNEVLVGQALADGGSPQPVVRLQGVAGVNGFISLTQFNVGAGGEAVGNFDVGVADPNGAIREWVGKFKANYCKAMETAQLP